MHCAFVLEGLWQLNDTHITDTRKMSKFSFKTKVPKPYHLMHYLRNSRVNQKTLTTAVDEGAVVLSKTSQTISRVT